MIIERKTKDIIEEARRHVRKLVSSRYGEMVGMRQRNDLFGGYSIASLKPSYLIRTRGKLLEVIVLPSETKGRAGVYVYLSNGPFA